jgi:multiple sugar transport system permease protein
MPSLSSKKKKWAYSFIMPVIVLTFLTQFLPIAWNIYISFHELDLYYMGRINEAPFVGFQNYSYALNMFSAYGSDFWNSIKVTLIYVTVSEISCYVLGMTAAILLNREFKGRNFLRGLFLLPWILPSVVSITTFSQMFSKNWGIINHILLKLHLISEPVMWLSGRNAIYALIISNVWVSWPFWYIILLGGMQEIPTELYEVAEIDGANAWQKLIYITIPMLKPVTTILFLLTSIWTFNDFSTPFILFGKVPPSSADLISIHIYNTTFTNWNFGLGAAMVNIVILFLTVVMLIYINKVGTWREEL